MSFLGPDDDLAVLEQALAFIDEFADAPVAVEGGGVPGSPLDVSDAASTVTAIKKKKRERNPEVDSRRRLRRKEERLALHRQVKELQRELAKTRQAFQPTAAVREPRAAKRRALRWLELLLEEQRRLETSRALNTQLKEVLSTQIALGNKLQEFADRFSPSATHPFGGSKELHVGRNALPTDSALPPSIRNAYCVPTIIDQLRDTAQRLHAEAMTSSEPLSAASVASNFSVKVDPVIGAYAEMKTAAPLGGSLSVVADLIDRGCVWTKFPVSRAEMAAPKTVGVKRAQAMDLIVAGSLQRFHALGVLFRSREADQIVLSYCILLFHPSGKLCFREGGWMTARQSKQQNECVFQSLSRLAPEILGDVSVNNEREIGQARDAGMQVLSEETKLKLQAVQRRLLVETGRLDLARLLPGMRPGYASPRVIRR